MRQARKAARGFTMIESMVAMSILLVGGLGLLSMQTLTARTTQFGQRMAQASALASDLSESVHRWNYTDTRLNSAQTIHAFSDSTVASRWDMGHSIDATYKADFSDQSLSDPHLNATTGDALTGYEGLSADLDRDSKADFARYWNVYSVDLSGSGTPDGKLVQIIVRWKDGSIYRQVTSSVFKRNPNNVF